MQIPGAPEPLQHKHILKEVNQKVIAKIREKAPAYQESWVGWGQDIIEEMPEFVPWNVPQEGELVEVGHLAQWKICCRWQTEPEFPEGTRGQEFQLTQGRLEDYMQDIMRSFEDQARQSYRSGDYFMAQIYWETRAELPYLVSLEPEGVPSADLGLWVRSS